MEGPTSSLLAILAGVTDPRSANAQRHGLLDILVIALAASVCGAETCVDFAEFSEDREELFREFLSLDNGLPSHDTYKAVCVHPESQSRFSLLFLRDFCPKTASHFSEIALGGEGLKVAGFFLLGVLVAGLYGAVTVQRRILVVPSRPAPVAGLALWFGM